MWIFNAVTPDRTPGPRQTNRPRHTNGPRQANEDDVDDPVLDMDVDDDDDDPYIGDDVSDDGDGDELDEDDDDTDDDEIDDDDDDINATPTPTTSPTPAATPRPTLAPAATRRPTLAPAATPRPTLAPAATPRPTLAPTATPRPTTRVVTRAPVVATRAPVVATRAPVVAPAPPSSASFTQIAAGDPVLSAKGRMPPVVTWSGRRAFEARFQRGKRGFDGSNANFDLAPRTFFPADQMRFAFKLFIDESFPWGPEMKKVGGKIIGLSIGSEDKASGGNYSPTAASFRLTWQDNGGLAPYLYPQIRGRYSKKSTGRAITWSLLDQSAEVQAAGTVSSGVHMWKREGDLQLRKGTWNTVEMFCKLNTPGRKDGIMGITVNGVTKTLKTVRYRNDNAKITKVHIGPFFGGGTLEYAPVRDTKMWYADFGFSRA